MTNKGERIRFIKGTYQDQKGWLNTDKKHTKHKYHVIVEPDLPERNYEKSTSVMKTSVRLETAETLPKTYEEALLHQHPDTDRLMDKLASELVKCHISGHESATELCRIFVAKLEVAHEKQQALGHKALWRDVIWDKGDKGD
jgi:glycerol-3-phosphate cytidylyltransferase-like family protein